MLFSLFTTPTSAVQYIAPTQKSKKIEIYVHVYQLMIPFTNDQNLVPSYTAVSSGLTVKDQLVANATRFLPVHLKIHVWSHHRALKAKVQCNFSSADHTNILRI